MTTTAVLTAGRALFAADRPPSVPPHVAVDPEVEGVTALVARCPPADGGPDRAAGLVLRDALAGPLRPHVVLDAVPVGPGVDLVRADLLALGRGGLDSPDVDRRAGRLGHAVVLHDDGGDRRPVQVLRPVGVAGPAVGPDALDAVAVAAPGVGRPPGGDPRAADQDVALAAGEVAPGLLLLDAGTDVDVVVGVVPVHADVRGRRERGRTG